MRITILAFDIPLIALKKQFFAIHSKYKINKYPTRGNGNQSKILVAAAVV